MGAETRDMQLIAHQLELEKLYSKNQTVERIRHEFENIEGNVFVEHMEKCQIPTEFGLSLLVQMVLHKRADIKTLVGLLYHHLKDSQKTVDMLFKCSDADLVDYDMTLKVFILKFDITPNVQMELDRFQYPLPMVVEPKPITDNRTSGYYLNQSSVILKNNHHEEDVCLDHLNRVNHIKFTLNMDVAQMVKNRWRNLDKKKEDETHEEFMLRRKAFEKYDRTTKDVMATLMRHSEYFYLTHKYDKRGRVYCQGYHVSYQSTPWNKAVIELADKELVE